MKIALFEVEPWEQESFRDLGTEHDIVFIEAPLTEETAAAHADAEIVSVFIYSKPNAAALSKLPKLRFVTTRSTGFDHIDLAWCREHGVAVANVPDYGQNTVAEHVFALLLAISHKLVESVDRTRRGDFSQQGLTGFDLQGRTLGVIGAGAIGRHTAKIARGFDMDVVAYDVQPDTEAAAEIGFEYADLPEVLARADAISVHLPGSPKTRNLISDEQFQQMKEGVVVINTARGGVIDVQALLRGLATGKVAAAGLDVLPEEPVIREEAELLRMSFQKEHDLETLFADHVLLRLRNVVITPHTAFKTEEAVQRILDTTGANIRAHIAGESLNVVT